MVAANKIKGRQKVVRFHKKGHKFYPLYEIVVTFKDNRNRGRCIEKLGLFNPNVKTDERAFYLNVNRLAFWCNNGVIVNKSVKKYIVKFLRFFE